MADLFNYYVRSLDAELETIVLSRYDKLVKIGHGFISYAVSATMATMLYIDLTLPTAAENLALDEALLEEAEASASPAETLRLWEPQRPLVVVGRSSRVADEVRLDVCRELDIPVLRRTSGGAAVVAGPGCLMYALVLSYGLRPQLRVVAAAHRWVLGTLAGALNETARSAPDSRVGQAERSPTIPPGGTALRLSHPTQTAQFSSASLVPSIQCKGTSDLALGELKFSGNSARLRRNHLLYHGTLLYDFPLELIGRVLTMPPRMPDYRGGRAHEGFVANLPLGPGTIRQALVSAFDAREPCQTWPEEQTARLVAEKYGRPEWNGPPA
jgi:lipoate---protein ligase